jgi:lipopolysaccharide transport system permease protein
VRALDVASPPVDRSGAIAVPVLVIRPSRGIGFPDLRALWQHRELLYFLVWRDVMVRYKQTVIGASWAILQPVLTMAIFAVVFGHFARIPSDGVPYPIFAYAALLPWTYFSQAVTRSAGSLVGNAGLITKVYFPRMIIPLASVMAPAVDFALALVPLVLCGGLIRWYDVELHRSIVTLPLFFVMMVAAALAVGLWLAPLNAKYRDIGHTIPFLTQVWLYASPVAYSLSLVPEQWRLLYGLNPMVGVIEGFRWALLGRDDPDLAVIALGASVVLVLLLGGLVNFRRMERRFADVV